MNVLLDTCIWSGAASDLRSAGHDVAWVGEWPEDPGDHEILARAFQEHRVLVTLDKDFGEIAIVRQMPHCGILRLVGFSARQHGPVCNDVLVRLGSELSDGAIVTVERGRIRVRPPQ